MYRTAPNHRRLAWRFLAGRVARVIAGAGLLGAAALAAAGAAPGAAAGTASASTAGRVPAVGPASAATPLWIHVSAGQRFSCGIREGNTLWCWGAGDNGSAPAPAGDPLGHGRSRPGLVDLGDGLAGERVHAGPARRVLGHGRHRLVDAGAALRADLGHNPLRVVAGQDPGLGVDILLEHRPSMGVCRGPGQPAPVPRGQVFTRAAARCCGPLTAGGCRSASPRRRRSAPRRPDWPECRGGPRR